jgi:hypothetical protein
VQRGIALDGLKPEQAPRLRYAVFAGDYYYPAGGWSDFRSAHATEPEALEAAIDAMTSGHEYTRPDWWQVVDLETMEIVKDRTASGKKRGW